MGRGLTVASGNLIGEENQITMRILLLTAMIFLVSTAVHGQSKANQSKNEASEFMLMQKAADDAENKKDLAMLDRLLTDDYIFTAPGGTVIDKKQLIAEVRKNAPEEGQTVTYDDAKAHIYGKAAVVNYLSIVKGR